MTSGAASVVPEAEVNSMTDTTKPEVAYGADQIISRKELKSFVQRTDRHALTHFLVHMAAIGGTGYLVYLSLGTWWAVPAMLLHALIMVNIYSPIHEGSHATPYRTRWLNEAVYRFLSLIYVQPPLYFRHRHAAHHTHTQIRGWDPDFPVPEEPRVIDYVWYVSAIPFWMRNIEWLVRNACGRISPADHYFIPTDEFPRIHWEARFYLGIYAAIAAVAIYFGSWAPLVFWLLPRIVGEPFRRLNNIAEHTGLPEHGNLLVNTRTTLVPRPLAFLLWNMNYHAEHHISSLVPYHALPRLHDHLKGRMVYETGLLNVHALILNYLSSRHPAPAAPEVPAE
jgi:fatty acid desaturase